LKALKAERPAIAKAMKRGAGIDQLGGKIGPDATKIDVQSQYLSRRFGVPLALAPTIADLVYGGAR